MSLRTLLTTLLLATSVTAMAGGKLNRRWQNALHDRAFWGVAGKGIAGKPAPTLDRVHPLECNQLWELACLRCRRRGLNSVPAHHIHMGNPDFQEFLTDDLEPQSLIKRRRIHLRTEKLLRLATLLGHANHRFHQLVADFKPAPILEHRHTPDLAAGQQAGGANRKVAGLKSATS